MHLCTCVASGHVHTRGGNSPTPAAARPRRRCRPVLTDGYPAGCSTRSRVLESRVDKMSWPRTLFISLLLLAALSVTACGGESSSPSPSPSPLPSPAATTFLTPTPSPTATQQGDEVAEMGDTVAVHYTGRLGNGTVFDSSVGGEPIRFVLGTGRIIVGFEQAVLGMKVGESKTVVIPAADAYGPHYDELVVTKSWAELPPGWEPKLGDQLPLTDSTGQVYTARVVEITESGVTLDANYPLAGKDLTFDIELVELLKP